MPEPQIAAGDLGCGTCITCAACWPLAFIMGAAGLTIIL